MALILNLEINRNKIYGSKENQTEDSLKILKRITLCYIDPCSMLVVGRRGPPCHMMGPPNVAWVDPLHCLEGKLLKNYPHN